MHTAFAERMTEEQDSRGMSDAALAKHASHYYPVSASTIWKMKHANPQRRVDIDEGDAISRALGYADVHDFLGRRNFRTFVDGLADLERHLDDGAEALQAAAYALAVLESLDREEPLMGMKADRVAWVQGFASDVVKKAAATRRDAESFLRAIERDLPALVKQQRGRKESK